MNEKLTVRQVVDQAVEAMLAMGQSPNTVWRAFYPRCTRLIRFYEQHQMEFYDPELTRAYTTIVICSIFYFIEPMVKVGSMLAKGLFVFDLIWTVGLIVIGRLNGE